MEVGFFFFNAALKKKSGRQKNGNKAIHTLLTNRKETMLLKVVIFLKL